MQCDLPSANSISSYLSIHIFYLFILSILLDIYPHLLSIYSFVMLPSICQFYILLSNYPHFLSILLSRYLSIKMFHMQCYLPCANSISIYLSIIKIFYLQFDLYYVNSISSYLTIHIYYPHFLSIYLIYLASYISSFSIYLSCLLGIFLSFIKLFHMQCDLPNFISSYLTIHISIYLAI